MPVLFSNVPKINHRSSMWHAFRQCLSEAVLRDENGIWPAENVSGDHLLLAHRQLASELQVEAVASFPLKDTGGKIVGSWLFAGPKELIQTERIERFGNAISPRIANAFSVVNRAELPILVSAAGIMAELCLASIAICVWASVDPGPLKYQMGLMFIAATVHTLLFNANPLMKFDGYYVLVDAIQIPNLYTRGRERIKALFSWLYLGSRFEPRDNQTRTESLIIWVYGFASLIWLILICISLSLAAISFFPGIGLVLAAIAMVFWLGLPLLFLLKFLLLGSSTEKPKRFRFAMATSVTLALFFAVMMLPAPGVIRAPVVFEYSNESVIRAPVSGFVNKIHVQPQSRVVAGQKLLTLENPELVAKREAVTIELEAAKLRANIYRIDQDIASWQIETDSIEALEKQLHELDEQCRAMEIVSPVDGYLQKDDLESITGTYVYPGEELLRVNPSEQLNAIALIRQSDAKWLDDQLSTIRVTLCPWGTDREIAGAISSLNPNSQDSIPHFAFSSTNGGELSTVSRQAVESSGPKSNDHENSRSTVAERKRKIFDSRIQRLDDYKLTKRALMATIKIDRNVEGEVSPGQTGTAYFTRRDMYLGDYLYRRAKRWISSRLRHTNGV